MGNYPYEHYYLETGKNRDHTLKLLHDMHQRGYLK
jgi:hypothetical protein